MRREIGLARESDTARSGAVRRLVKLRRQQPRQAGRTGKPNDDARERESVGGSEPKNQRLLSSAAARPPKCRLPLHRGKQPGDGARRRGGRPVAKLAERYGNWLEARGCSAAAGRAERAGRKGEITSPRWESTASHRAAHARISSGQKCVTRGILVTLSNRLLSCRRRTVATVSLCFTLSPDQTRARKSEHRCKVVFLDCLDRARPTRRRASARPFFGVRPKPAGHGSGRLLYQKRFGGQSAGGDKSR